MNNVVRIVIESSVQSAALAFCVGVILAAARIRSGAVRHAAWLAVLCGMMLMPVLSRVTPKVQVPIALPAIADADVQSEQLVVGESHGRATAAGPVALPALRSTPPGCYFCWLVWSPGGGLPVKSLVRAPGARPGHRSNGLRIGTGEHPTYRGTPLTEDCPSCDVARMDRHQTTGRTGSRGGAREESRRAGESCGLPEPLCFLVSSFSVVAAKETRDHGRVRVRRGRSAGGRQREGIRSRPFGCGRSRWFAQAQVRTCERGYERRRRVGGAHRPHPSG